MSEQLDHWGAADRIHKLVQQIRDLGHEPVPVTCPGCQAVQTIEGNKVLQDHEDGCSWVSGWAAWRKGRKFAPLTGSPKRVVEHEDPKKAAQALAKALGIETKNEETPEP